MIRLKSSQNPVKAFNSKLGVGLIVLLVVIILNLAFSQLPALYEALYLNSSFQIIRILHDFTLGWLPVPSLYLIVPALLFFFFRRSYKGAKSFLKSLLVFLVWIVNLFYILWGFNYQQTNLRDRLDLGGSTVDSSYIDQAFEAQTVKLTFLADQIDGMSLPESSEDDLRLIQEKILKGWGIPTLGRVRVRKLPGGSLLHLRTTGIYIPHAFEGHLDKGMYPLQYPFTLAHEMAHGYGITDESECNFIAYLSCTSSTNPVIKFSAELSYWRYLAGYYRRLHPDSWQEVYKGLDPQLLYHLDEIRKHVSRYRDWMPKYRDIIYDRYLKSHGVKAGISSYNEMIVLIKAYLEKNGEVGSR